MTFVFQSSLLGKLPSSNRDVILDEVVLQAESTADYDLAAQSHTWYEEWLSEDQLLQQGDVCTMPSNNPTHKFVVLMTSPVLRGFVRKGSTRVSVAANHTALHEISIPSDATDTSEDMFEIDEDFLGNAMLAPSAHQHPLSDEGQAAKWTLRSNSISEDYDDECTVSLRPGDLSRLGALNGDWALIGTRAHRNQRLVCVQADDSRQHTSGSIIASSLLAYNISKNVADADVTLRSTPFGSHPPPIPVAKAITVARVASPLSIDRAYQSAFLQSLQDYFRRRKRLVKQGDLIAVRVDTDETRHFWAHESAEEAEPTSSEVILSSFQDAMRSTNSVVYFVITNLEHDLIADTNADGFDGSYLGEWGCWIDHSVTRIIQTGVEHSRVPSARPSTKTGESSEATGSLGKLHALVSAAFSQSASEYRLQLSILLHGARGTGKMTAVTHVAEQLGLHVLEVNCYGIIGENDVQTEAMLRIRFEKAASCSPCILVLRHVDALSQTTQGGESGKANVFADVVTESLADLQQSWGLTGHPVILVGTVEAVDQTPARLVSCFKHELQFGAPDESERHSILRSLLQESSLAPDVSIKDLAVQTAALLPSDLVDLAARGEHAYLQRAAPMCDYNARDLYVSGVNISAGDLDAALNKARLSYSESIGAPKIPNVSWDDVGGLASVKSDILDTIQLPLEHPELFANGMKKRSGILLYGPPGTGKTLLAKAVATSCALNFFSVKGPELLNMYIGESEANVRRVFQRARDAKPCVIFFDELDSVAPKRGNHGDSGGVMDRIVSQLLAELDGIAGGEAGADVFVIGATNRPDLLDSALLRPGRFDRMLYLGVSQTHDAQLNILQALTRKFKLHPSLSLRAVAESCPFHYTGADFYALCSDALLKAMSRKAEELEDKIAALNASGDVDPKHPHPLTPQYYLAEMASQDDIDVLVMQEDFESALRDLVPSVSQAEMDHYARVQKQFSQETINSDS